MTEQLGSASIVEEESTMYMEKNVPGKGVGCVAKSEIKKGSLVLREYPQLLTPEDDDSVTLKEQAQSIIDAFLKMPDEDKERYLQLHNMYFDDDGLKEWSEGMERRVRSLNHATNGLTFPNISRGKAFEVWAIYTSNFFHNGVCINLLKVVAFCEIRELRRG